MTDRIPGAPGRCKAVVTGEDLRKLQAGEEFAITLRRDDQPIKEGTPYSKAAVLPDAVAAALCPGADDPTPGDAFGALQSQKADTTRRSVGQSVIIRDATHTPLRGLRILGRTQNGTNVGDSGTITLHMAGKNLLDLSAIKGTSVSANGGTLVCGEDGGITGSGTPTGYVGFLPFRVNLPKTKVTLSVSGTSENIACVVDLIDASGAIIATISRVSVHTTGATIDISQYPNYAYASVTIKRNNNVEMSGTAYFQIEIGNVVTPYEPYQPPQTLAIPTEFGGQNGLAGNGTVYDEIDLAKGVVIHRVFNNAEYSMYTDILEEYAKLHTYTPTTVITNDAGAEMEVTYYTATTAVQMVHAATDKGKTFTIDQHGCVSLTRDNPVIACGDTTLDGVTWYYRKWADGFAECWAQVSNSYASEEGAKTEMPIILPFAIRNSDGNQPSVHLRLSNEAYQFVDVGDVLDYEGLLAVIVTVPEDALVDEFVSYRGDVYVAGYWKQMEVAE